MNLSEFTNLLIDVNLLDVKGDKIIEPRLKANKDKEQLFSMAIDDLAEIDHRIPAAIEGQLAVTKEIMEGKALKTIYGHLFRRTLQIWQNEKMIPTIEAGVIAYDTLWDFEKVKLNKKKQLVQMAIFGSRIRDFTSKDGVSIKLSGRTLKETFTVCPVWLEDNYPGWKNRYLVASALGYEGQELVNYTLSDTVELMTAPNSVDGVTFY